MPSAVDERFYEVAGSGTSSEKVLIWARNRIFARFNQEMAPRQDETIVDVGVSDVITDGANFLERLYDYPEHITACGLGDASGFERAHPRCTYVRIDPSEPLPFPDGRFDVATSNAVLEHVGSLAAQRTHIAELCRVARRAFVSVPNRFFPVEHHTGIPFLHWTDAGFRAATKALGKDKWADERELILMTRARLSSLVPAGRRAQVGHTGLQLGPWSSNLFMSIR